MLFAAPKIIETSVFARLPDELKNADHTNEWVAGQPLGTPAGSLLEGPSFDREGNFWCVDIQNGRIFKVTRDGSFHLIAEYDGWPNGLKFHRDGRIFIADYKNGIMLLDPVQRQSHAVPRARQRRALQGRERLCSSLPTAISISPIRD